MYYSYIYCHHSDKKKGASEGIYVREMVFGCRLTSSSMILYCKKTKRNICHITHWFRHSQCPVKTFLTYDEQWFTLATTSKCISTTEWWPPLYRRLHQEVTEAKHRSVCSAHMSIPYITDTHVLAEIKTTIVCTFITTLWNQSWVL